MCRWSIHRHTFRYFFFSSHLVFSFYSDVVFSFSLHVNFSFSVHMWIFPFCDAIYCVDLFTINRHYHGFRHDHYLSSHLQIGRHAHKAESIIFYFKWFSVKNSFRRKWTNSQCQHLHAILNNIKIVATREKHLLRQFFSRFKQDFISVWVFSWILFQ